MALHFIRIFFKLACLRIAAQFLHVYYFTFHFSYLIKVIIQIKKEHTEKCFSGLFASENKLVYTHISEH